MLTGLVTDLSVFTSPNSSLIPACLLSKVLKYLTIIIVIKLSTIYQRAMTYTFNSDTYINQTAYNNVIFSFISGVKYIFFRLSLNLEVVIDAPFLLLPKCSLYVFLFILLFFFH